MIELDANATTPPLPAVIDAANEALTTLWHNPSSGHRAGQAARQRVELARQSVAKLINARPRDVVFTSGATESINLAFRGTLALAPPSRRTILISPIEHEAVRDLAAQLESDPDKPFAIRHAPLTPHGTIDVDATLPLIDDSLALVSIMWANNETGAINDIAPIAKACRKANVPFHTDATQHVGKLPTDVHASQVSLLSCSAHKLHGPKGVGILYIRPRFHLKPLFPGPHEMERRAGTENVPGILGFGAAAEEAAAWIANPDNPARIATLRDALEAAILEAIPSATVNAARAPRLWNTTNIAFPPLEAEALLILLSERAVNASAGAACASGSLEPSPVLAAMGIPDPAAHASIRFSLSRLTTQSDIDAAVPLIIDSVKRLHASATSVA